jgi:hypothetical protein
MGPSSQKWFTTVSLYQKQRADGRFESGNLNYTYISDELDRIPAGATDQDKLLRVRRKFFIIEAADGKRRRYLRIW